MSVQQRVCWNARQISFLLVSQLYCLAPPSLWICCIHISAQSCEVFSKLMNFSSTKREKLTCFNVFQNALIMCTCLSLLWQHCVARRLLPIKFRWSYISHLGVKHVHSFCLSKSCIDEARTRRRTPIRQQKKKSNVCRVTCFIVNLHHDGRSVQWRIFTCCVTSVDLLRVFSMLLNFLWLLVIIKRSRTE